MLTTSAEQTQYIARAFARSAQPGARMGLVGDLGLGKTTFAKGFADALGIDPTHVTSPTYTLIQEYPCHHGTFYHVDIYRLDSMAEIDALGLDEICFGDGNVVLVEWSDKHPVLPDDSLLVRFKETPQGRDIELEAGGPSAEEWLQRWRTTWQ